MAKQGGIHKIRGKIGEASYYQSQVGGYLIRGINQGMSNRVKNDPAFANTRLNAAEFGGAGMLSGAMISAVSRRWRYMLYPTATGLLTAVVKNAMAMDTTQPWGERAVLLTQMPSIQDAYNSLSKNEMIPEIVDVIRGATLSDEEHIVTINNDAVYSEDTAQRLLSQGVEGVIVTIYTFNVDIPRFVPSVGKYFAPSRYLLRTMYSEDTEVAAGEPLLTGGDLNVVTDRFQYQNPQNAVNHLGGLLVVVTPYKVVSNQKHILQELCSCYWSSVSDEQ